MLSDRTPRLDRRSILILIIVLTSLACVSWWVHSHFGGIQHPPKATLGSPQSKQ